MRPLIVSWIAVILAGVALTVCAVHAGTSLYIARKVTTTASQTMANSVGLQSVIDALLALPDGGPQALEGYTKIAHDRGNTRLALGIIGNVEMNGHGDVAEVRSLQAGGVVTNNGHVRLWTGLYLDRPKAGEGYAGPVNIERVDYITFDNGWSIRPNGSDLTICRPSGECRPF